MKVMLWKHGVNDGTQDELPHIGLGILSREIKDAGHDVFAADHHYYPVDDNVAISLLEKERPDILGVSITSQEWAMPAPQAVIDKAYEMGITVWVGGPHTTGYWDILEKDQRLSKVVVGEADGSFEDILKSEDRIIHLSPVTSLHTPDFTFMMNYQSMTDYPIYTSMGCQYSCSFCSGTKTHARWRPRPLDDYFWDEMDAISRKYPSVTQACVIDDNFTADQDRAKFFINEFLRRGYPCRLNIMNVRADQIDEEYIELMKKLGIDELSIGVESADPEVARMMTKGETLETIRNAIELIQHAGITPWLHMIIGLPGDSPEAHKRSLDWVLSIPTPRIVQWNQYAPYRGTRAYDYFVKQGDLEDGFLPGFSAIPYDQFPQYGFFDSKGFSREQKMLAQLEAYLRCNTPILILSDERVRKTCQEHGMEELYQEWRKNAPIERFIANRLPKKIKKGQVSESASRLLS